MPAILEIDSGDFDFTDCEVFQPDDFVIFVGRAKRQEREFMKRLTPGVAIKLKDEEFLTDSFIGLPVGASVITPLNQSYLMLKPTLAQRVMNMPREAQILYPKDLALILYYTDIRPGCRAVEIGVGHGAMSMSLVRAVGETGSVTSYEIREDFMRRTAKNVERYLGPTPWWEIKLQNPATDGIDEKGLDAAVIDMPTPWEVVEAVAEALRPSGTATFFIPTVPQVMQLNDALMESKKFTQYRTTEAIQRPWRVIGQSVRPEMRIAGHSGFLVNCRRKLGHTVRLRKKQIPVE